MADRMPVFHPLSAAPRPVCGRRAVFAAVSADRSPTYRACMSEGGRHLPRSLATGSRRLAHTRRAHRRDQLGHARFCERRMHGPEAAMQRMSLIAAVSRCVRLTSYQQTVMPCLAGKVLCPSSGRLHYSRHRFPLCGNRFYFLLASQKRRREMRRRTRYEATSRPTTGSPWEGPQAINNACTTKHGRSGRAVLSFGQQFQSTCRREITSCEGETA